jgi:hypothetical protein
MRLYLDTGDLNRLHGDRTSAVTAHREIGHPVTFASWDGPLERAARREGLEVLAR